MSNTSTAKQQNRIIGLNSPICSTSLLVVGLLSSIIIWLIRKKKMAISGQQMKSLTFFSDFASPVKSGRSCGLCQPRLGVGTNGYFLKANSSTTTGLEWGTASSVSVLDDLTDVVITTPASGQVLEYNGSSWVNKNTIRDNMIRFYMEVI